MSIDSPKVLDSTTALELPDVPNRLLVVGGGYIGLELGTVYAALGSKVTVVEMTDGLLPGADRDLAAVVAKRMATYAEAILLETKVTGVKDDKKGLAVSLEGKNAPAGPQNFDRVLVAVGRRPNSAIGGLDKTKVKVNPRGFIEVDGQRRTAEPSIFAIGDVAGDPMLAHKASHEARVAVEAIHGKPVGVRAARHPGRGLYRSRAGLDRPHRNRREEAEHSDRNREVPVGGVRTRDDARSAGRLDEAHHRSRDRAHPRRGHRRRRRRRADLARARSPSKWARARRI